MESAGKRTRLKRKPLADCTNTLSALKRTEKLPSNPSKVPLSEKSQESSIGSNAALNTDITPISTGSPYKSVKISDDVCKKGPENVAVVTRPTQQQRMKDKGKAIIDSIPSSCPPIGRSRNFSGRADKLKKNSEDGLPMENPISPPKMKKKRRHSLGSVLPQDFIDKQRAYFAEVDKFELAEEEVSPSEMDD